MMLAALGSWGPSAVSVVSGTVLTLLSCLPPSTADRCILLPVPLCCGDGGLWCGQAGDP